MKDASSPLLKGKKIRFDNSVEIQKIKAINKLKNLNTSLKSGNTSLSKLTPTSQAKINNKNTQFFEKLKLKRRRSSSKIANAFSIGNMPSRRRNVMSYNNIP